MDFHRFVHANFEDLDLQESPRNVPPSQISNYLYDRLEQIFDDVDQNTITVIYNNRVTYFVIDVTLDNLVQIYAKRLDCSFYVCVSNNTGNILVNRVVTLRQLFLIFNREKEENDDRVIPLLRRSIGNVRIPQEIIEYARVYNLTEVPVHIQSDLPN